MKETRISEVRDRRRRNDEPSAQPSFDFRKTQKKNQRKRGCSVRFRTRALKRIESDRNSVRRDTGDRAAATYCNRSRICAVTVYIRWSVNRLFRSPAYFANKVTRNVKREKSRRLPPFRRDFRGPSTGKYLIICLMRFPRNLSGRPNTNVCSKRPNERHCFKRRVFFSPQTRSLVRPSAEGR